MVRIDKRKVIGRKTHEHLGIDRIRKEDVDEYLSKEIENPKEFVFVPTHKKGFSLIQVEGDANLIYYINCTPKVYYEIFEDVMKHGKAIL